eukprot:scaffold721_cov235-Pinguiococcus_pyrenoidosus.AAC.5
MHAAFYTLSRARIENRTQACLAVTFVLTFAGILFGLARRALRSETLTRWALGTATPALDYLGCRRARSCSARPGSPLSWWTVARRSTDSAIAAFRRHLGESIQDNSVRPVVPVVQAIPPGRYVKVGGGGLLLGRKGHVGGRRRCGRRPGSRQCKVVSRRQTSLGRRRRGATALTSRRDAPREAAEGPRGSRCWASGAGVGTAWLPARRTARQRTGFDA